MVNNGVHIPVDSIYALQKSLSGVELLAHLSLDTVTDKKPNGLNEVAFHCVRPWLAAMDPKGAGVVWNYETKEVVTEFSLEMPHDASAFFGSIDDDDDDFISTATPEASGTTTPTSSATHTTATTAMKGLLAKAGSPTSSFIKATRGRSGSLRMFFFDHDSIQWTTKHNGDRIVYDEWIVILTATRIIFCDLNQPSTIRTITTDDLQKQVPCCIEILPSGLLAIGCHDGKIRIWDPRQWRMNEVMETSSTKEVQELLLLPASTISESTTTWMHYLISFTIDGHITTWKVNSLTGDCTKIGGNLDIRDSYRPYDTGSGINEFKYHAHQEMMTAATKEGTVYFFDASALIKQGRLPLVGVLPSTRLPCASVIAGPRKGSFVIVSMANGSPSLVLSEISNKGRAVGKDGLPANYHEYAIGTTMETRDLRIPVHLSALKKYKMMGMVSSTRKADEFCCITSFGLFVLKTTILANIKPIFVTRQRPETETKVPPPLVLYPGPTRVTLRFYGEETSPKQEDLKLQCPDSSNEKLKTPVLQICPSNVSYFSALLPASTHIEIVQMDSELRNQKLISMHSVFSGNAIAIAWHATKPRFSMLVPLDSNARRLTRAASSMNAPRRRGFIFGGNKHGLEDEANAAAEARAKNSMARAMTLAVYEIGSDGNVQVVEDQISCGSDRLLHIFSGPLLGVVRYEANENEVVPPPPPSTASEGLSAILSPMRGKRADSSVLSTTPTAGASGNGHSASFSSSECDTSDLTKTTLEFFEWDAVNGAGGIPILKRVGTTTIPCPLFMEWERKTHRFCALVYPKCIKIYRISSTPTADIALLHEIHTSHTATSIHWMHHTLFVASDDIVMCYVISKSRIFKFDLASRYSFSGSSPSIISAMPLLGQKEAALASLQYPPLQEIAMDATTILGISQQGLVLAAPGQALHLIDLTNRVLQCCLLIAIGQPDLAVQVAETLSVDLCDWIGSVFEAFGFVSHALQLSKLSLRYRVNIAIKHKCFDELTKTLLNEMEKFPTSLDITGVSLLQRACTCLCRGGYKDQLSQISSQLMQQHRYHDAAFTATILQRDDLVADALAAAASWGGAFHATERISTSNSFSVLSKWNIDISSPMAPWKSILEQQQISPPESVILTK